MSKATIEKTLKEMDRLLIEAFNVYTLPGLAVGVVHEGKLVYTRTFGFANLEKETPVTTDTVFRIMSISKTFTSIGIMQLWEQGKLDLDAPVNRYLKSMKVLHKDPDTPSITLRHLLTHTAGIGETRGWMDLTRPVGGLGAQPDTRILPMPEYYSGRLTPEIYPGEKWAYSNHAFAVLAQVIEDVSGEPFSDYMLKHVFGPLDMTQTDYILSPRVSERLAQGYQFKKGRFVPYPYLRLNTPGCGGIFSSVNEMAKYVSALMYGGKNESGSVLKPETLQMMMTSQLDTDPRIFSMGIGFILEHYGKYLVAEHGGGWPGFISSMQVVPEAKLAILAFTNSSSGAPEYITRDLLHRMLGLPIPTDRIPDQTILQRPMDWQEFCGSYGPKPGPLTNARFWMSMGGEVQVYVQNGRLMMRSLVQPASKGVPLYNADPLDPMIYKGKIKEGQLENQVITVVFQRNVQGEIDRLNVHTYVLYKRPVQQSLRFKLGVAGGALAGGLLALLSWKLRKKRKP